MPLYVLWLYTKDWICAPRHSTSMTLFLIARRNLLQKYGEEAIHLDRVFDWRECPVHRRHEPCFRGAAARGFLNRYANTSRMEFRAYGIFIPDSDLVIPDIFLVTPQSRETQSREKTLEFSELVPDQIYLHLVFETCDSQVVDKVRLLVRRAQGRHEHAETKPAEKTPERIILGPKSSRGMGEVVPVALGLVKGWDNSGQPIIEVIEGDKDILEKEKRAVEEAKKRLEEIKELYRKIKQRKKPEEKPEERKS